MAHLQKGAFKDVPLKIKFNMLEEENIKPLVRRMKAWLMNGKTLYFTDDDVYRKIKHVVVGDIANEIEEHGEFEVDFTLDPFEYTEDANIMLSTPGSFIIQVQWNQLQCCSLQEWYISNFY